MSQRNHTAHIDAVRPERAPDGSTVFPLVRTNEASLAQFRFAAGSLSAAVRHRSVTELWYVLAGTGELWRENCESPITPLGPGQSVTIERGKGFQVRVSAAEDLVIIGSTVPPWPTASNTEAEAIGGWWQ